MSADTVIMPATMGPLSSKRRYDGEVRNTDFDMKHVRIGRKSGPGVHCCARKSIRLFANDLLTNVGGVLLCRLLDELSSEAIADPNISVCGAERHNQLDGTATGCADGVCTQDPTRPSVLHVGRSFTRAFPATKLIVPLPWCWPRGESLLALIILADDDELLGEVVRDALSTRGHAVGIVRNGSDAVQAVKTKHPELVILDCMMPGTNGIEALVQIRLSAHAYSTPVLMLTGRRSDMDVEIAMRAGASSYLKKPFEIGQLVNRVENLLI